MLAGGFIEMREFLGVVSALALLGCEAKMAPAGRADEVAPAMQVTWQQLPDGSYFYVNETEYKPSSAGFGQKSIQAERCWKEESTYRCIIFTNSNDSSFWYAERQDKFKLEATTRFNTGYSCSVVTIQPFDIHYEEMISRKSGSDLLTNFKSPRSPVRNGWTREFIENYMIENEVPRPNSWFRCAGVREILLSGGGKTLGTTAATRTQLFGTAPEPETKVAQQLSGWKKFG